MKAIKLLLKSVLIFVISTLKLVLVFVVLILFIKGWFFYQRNYVCTQKIKQGINRFVKDVMAKEYNGLSEIDKSVFIDEKHFYSIKKNFSKKYTVVISYWGPIWYAYCVVSFDGNHKYGFTLVPSEEPLFFTGKIKYSIKSVKEIKS